MPKSGPAELKAYHQQVLEAEARKGKRKMAQTDFNVETLDGETLAARQAKVAEILHPKAAPAAAKDEKIITKADTPAQAPLPAPIPAPAEPEQKRTRTTVPKLLQRYQERMADTGETIIELEKVISTYQAQLEAARSKQVFLRELIDEINSD